MSSYTYSQTFTETHAKHIAAKVATDLKRIQRFYGELTDTRIGNYEKEIIQYLKKGYLTEVTYGFKKNGQWIEPTLRYTAKELSISGIDDDPGKVRPNADVSGATFYSYLVSSDAFANASSVERENFYNSLPFLRGGADAPGVNGYFSSDKLYSSGGKGLDRSTLKKY
jgi:hypothetical protein